MPDPPDAPLSTTRQQGHLEIIVLLPNHAVEERLALEGNQRLAGISHRGGRDGGCVVRDSAHRFIIIVPDLRGPIHLSSAPWPPAGNPPVGVAGCLSPPLR